MNIKKLYVTVPQMEFHAYTDKISNIYYCSHTLKLIRAKLLSLWKYKAVICFSSSVVFIFLWCMLKFYMPSAIQRDTISKEFLKFYNSPVLVISHEINFMSAGPAWCVFCGWTHTK